MWMPSSALSRTTQSCTVLFCERLRWMPYPTRVLKLPLWKVSQPTTWLSRASLSRIP